jgi:hypothetical protein
MGRDWRRPEARSGLPAMPVRRETTLTSVSRSNAKPMARRSAKRALPMPPVTGSAMLKLNGNRYGSGNTCRVTPRATYSGFNFPVQQKPAGDLSPQREVIDSTLLELQQARGLLVEDVDFHHADRRHGLDLHALDERRPRRIAARRKVRLAVAGLGVEYVTRAALAFPQAKRPAAGRTRADVATGGFDHLTHRCRDEADHVLNVGVVDFDQTQFAACSGRFMVTLRVRAASWPAGRAAIVRQGEAPSRPRRERPLPL